MSGFYLVHFKMKLLNLDIRLFSTIKWHTKELYKAVSSFQTTITLRRKNIQ